MADTRELLESIGEKLEEKYHARLSITRGTSIQNAMEIFHDIREYFVQCGDKHVLWAPLGSMERIIGAQIDKIFDARDAYQILKNELTCQKQGRWFCFAASGSYGRPPAIIILVLDDVTIYQFVVVSRLASDFYQDTDHASTRH